MGVNISDLVSREPIRLESLKGKKIAIDTYIELYQFLKTMPLLMNKEGKITSHLLGLFFRTTHLMSLGIKPCFVFDGPFPEIKKHKKVTKPGGPRTTTTISLEMINDSKLLLELLGLPVIQAPSEAEAQAAWMAKKRDVWAVASQDFDSLIFGAPRMIKNLTLAKERKLPKGGVVLIGTYLIEFKKLLKNLKINKDQLIALAMLIGTDFNPGVHGIGQKKGLLLVKKYKNNLNKLFRDVKLDSWKDIFDCIKTMPVTNNYRLKWKSIDGEGLINFLVKKHNFNEKRVKNAIAKI